MTVENTSELEVLVDQLLAETRHKQVDWKLEGGSLDIVAFYGASGSVRIYAKDRDERHPFYLEVRDPQGEVVNLFLTGTEREADGSTTFGALSVKVGDLYLEARSNSGVSVIGGLLRELATEPKPDFDQEPY